MSIKINYSNKLTNKSLANLVLFVDQNFNISGLKKIISNTEFSYISDLLKTSDLKKNLLFFEINSKKTIFLVSIKNDLKISDIFISFLMDIKNTVFFELISKKSMSFFKSLFFNKSAM